MGLTVNEQGLPIRALKWGFKSGPLSKLELQLIAWGVENGGWFIPALRTSTQVARHYLLTHFTPPS